MDSIGAEVGQKMRSAIKAKLLELNCYVDEELPDYIMVMVANKRSKSQMNEDLKLFLSTKTSTFVDWLHIVLKKLKEVTVTNPDIYRRVISPRSPIQMDTNVKSEINQYNISLKAEGSESKSLGKELKFSEERKVSIIKQDDSFDDNFDIPLLSEVSMSTQEDLDELERKIRSVKSRLGMLVESDAEDGPDHEGNNSDEHRNLLGNRRVEILENSTADVLKCHSQTTDESLTKKRKHTPITFDLEDSPKRKRRSIHERLGRRIANEGDERREEFPLEKFRESRHREHRTDSSRKSSDNRKDKNKSILGRLGVMSKVSVPHREPPEPELEDELKTRDVRSMVQVKPRVIPPDISQPNKNLLLKAVAEAQKSIEQATSLKKKQSSKKYDVPDKQPVVHHPASFKNRERCKYWPGCKQGDICEFFHPTSSCENFPNCKFGEKCMFLHPTCKFGTSCTKRDCQFSHTTATTVETGWNNQPKMNVSAQVCKYYPKCAKSNCVYYHPKTCMYGKYCKNQSTCGFVHFPKGHMTWKLK